MGMRGREQGIGNRKQKNHGYFRFWSVLSSLSGYIPGYRSEAVMTLTPQTRALANLANA
jgi:hypothetical protein